MSFFWILYVPTRGHRDHSWVITKGIKKINENERKLLLINKNFLKIINLWIFV